MRYFLSALLLLFSFGCRTPYVDPSLKLSDESDYFHALEKFTVHKQVYDGFNAVLDFHMYFLNTYVMKYQVDENARIYQWNASTYDAEKAKIQSDLEKQTTYYMTFFTPDRHNDDLNKEKTKWRVFLDVDGHRYEAKVEKMKTPAAEVLSLYPQHNRWSTAYKLMFPVPNASVENKSSKVTLTGPVGHTEVEYRPLSEVLSP